MAKKGYVWCPNCYEEYWVNSDLISHDGDCIRDEYCKKIECQNVKKDKEQQEEELQNKQQKINEYYEKKKKEIELKALKKKQEILDKALKDINNLSNCLDCHCFIPLNESAYRWENKTPYCKKCITDKIINSKLQNDNSSSSDSSKNGEDNFFSPPNDSETHVCSICKKTSSEDVFYFPENPNKIFCSECKPHAEILRQCLNQIIQGQSVDIDNLNLREDGKVILRIFQKIKNGEKVDIDNSNIDEKDKQNLREFQKKINENKQGIERNKNNSAKKTNSEERGTIIGGIIVIILGISWAIFYRKFRRKKKIKCS